MTSNIFLNFTVIGIGFFYFIIDQPGAPKLMTQKKDPYLEKRNKMVDKQIIARGIHDQKVLDAMRRVPRHLYVPEKMKPLAYRDEPLPIGHGQTISQPYIVAYMTEVLQLTREEKIDVVLSLLFDNFPRQGDTLPEYKPRHKPHSHE